MKNPLPVREIRGIIGDKGFLRLYGQDTFLYVSDLPRRVSGSTLEKYRQTLLERGFAAEVDSSELLLIDLQPVRWEALMMPFQAAEPVPFPQDEALHGVYALARLLIGHPSVWERQPMDMIRAVMKHYTAPGGLLRLAPQLTARCAQKLRCGEPLPSALAKVLFVWLQEQSGSDYQNKHNEES